MLPSALTLLSTYKYAIIIPLAIFEGPVIMMISGFLIRMGLLDLTIAYICLMIGDLMGDIIWYSVGYFGGDHFVERFGRFFGVTKEGVASVKKIFHRYHKSILIISKVTMGFGFSLVTLITAGLAKIPFRSYLILNIVGEFFWTGALIAVGYYLGNFYLQVDNILGKISIIALFVIIFFILVGFGKYISKRFTTIEPS